MFEQGYREIVSLPSALTGYKRLLTDVAEAEHRPALFHCTTGQGPHGLAAAAMLMLLGVRDDLVMEEYLLTNTELLPALQPVVDQFQAQGGEPELLMPVLGVQLEYLEASLDETRTRFGAIEAYFAEGLGIDAATQQALRTVFVESA
jgi:protein-tyrosine phosphatase